VKPHERPVCHHSRHACHAADLAADEPGHVARVRHHHARKIADVSVFQSNGKTWASFPGKPLIGDGKALLDDRGKQRYTQFMEWTDKAASDRFSAAVVAAVVAAYGPAAMEPPA